MTDETKAVDPEVDNSTPLATEIKEQPTPSKEDNVEIDTKVEPEVEPEIDTEVDPSKEERYKQQLQGSKEEALRWRTEAQKLQDEIDGLKSKETTNDDIAVAEEDLALFNAMGKKLGYVKQEELDQKDQVKTYKQEQNEALNKFLKEYPDYNKPGDPESDKKWKALEGGLSLYNAAPSDPKAWYTILKKAHRDLNDNPDLERQKGEALAMAKVNMAEQAKIGGRSSGEAFTPKGKQTPEQQQFSSEVEEQLRSKPYYQSK